jgi:small subunit ribosomal protein S1
VVLNVNPQERRISLGMRNCGQSLGEPAREIPRRHDGGRPVRNLTDFGAFIEIEDGIDGLVHVSNLSWTKRVKHPSEVLKKGDKVKAIVLAIEPDKRRLSLGVKQLQPDVWESFFETAPRRRRAPGQECCAWPASAPSSKSPRASKASATTPKRWTPTASRSLEPGQEHDFKIIKMNRKRKKVGLSIRAVGEEASRTEVEAYKQP